MHKEDSSTNSGTHFSDVWANAQSSRSLVLSALLRNGWRRLFGSASARRDQPVNNARQYLGA
jgi:hypothetical protein